MSSITMDSQNSNAVSNTIIELERDALERWNNGDPSGYLEISAEDVVYFDPVMEQRLDGLDKLTELYEKIRGEVHVDKYEIINPKVQTADKMAVLTFNLISYAGEKKYRWNCTEVYRKEKDNKWRIIQTLWSLTTPNISIT